MDNAKKIQNVTEKIKQKIKNLNIPYFEVIANKGYDEIYRIVIKNKEDENKNLLYMYSCTKPLTVTCVMQLVEKGKLKLEDKLISFVPAFKETFYKDAQGEMHIVGDKITIFHLLTMTAGLNYHLGAPAIKALFENGNEPTTEEVVNAIAKSPLSFMPGERFNYSLCHDVLARVVEVVSGLKFSEYIKQNVFEPLGMDDSGFEDNRKDKMLPLFIMRDGKMEPNPLHNDYCISKNYQSGGAGLIGTIEDYNKFAISLANDGVYKNGAKILNEDTLALIRKEHISIGDISRQFTCVQGEDYSYGLGVRTRIKDTEWGLNKGEFGWDGAAGSYLMIDPNKKVSIVMGMHIRSWPVIFTGEHLDIVKEIYQNLL